MRRARAFVVNGRAEWVAFEHSIRFLAQAEIQAHQCLHEAQALRAAEMAKSLQADRAVHAVVANHKQIKGLPLNRPTEMLAPSPRKYFWWRKAVDVRVNRAR